MFVSLVDVGVQLAALNLIPQMAFSLSALARFRSLQQSSAKTPEYSPFMVTFISFFIKIHSDGVDVSMLAQLVMGTVPPEAGRTSDPKIQN